MIPTIKLDWGKFLGQKSLDNYGLKRGQKYKFLSQDGECSLKKKTKGEQYLPHERCIDQGWGIENFQLFFLDLVIEDERLKGLLSIFWIGLIPQV